MSNFDKVKQFHEVFRVPYNEHAELPSQDRIELRVRLIQEEFDEFREAVINGDLVEVADALTDMLYVIYGTGIEFGIDLDKCFAEVHRSNMSKLDDNGKPIYREDGKILKGPNFTPPNLSVILRFA